VTVTATRRPFPGFGRLYELSDPPPYPQLCGILAVDDYADLIGLVRGERRPPRPLTVHLDREAAPGDVIWLENVAGALVSERVIDLFRQRALTGWATYPVTVVAPLGATQPGYHGLAVTGRCGPLDWSHRQPLVARSDSPYALYRGYTFEPGSWDGSDLFLWELAPGFDAFADFPFATEAVKATLEGSGIANVWLRSLAEIEAYVSPEELAPPSG
jgi:hypothetical protein